MIKLYNIYCFLGGGGNVQNQVSNEGARAFRNVSPLKAITTG